MISRITMAVLTGTMYFTPISPRGISSVSAASGPYAAELSASNPKTGIPAMGPMHSARSSLVASGRPKSSVDIRVEKAIQKCPAAEDSVRGKPSMPVSHAAALRLGREFARACACVNPWLIDTLSRLQQHQCHIVVLRSTPDETIDVKENVAQNHFRR